MQTRVVFTERAKVANAKLKMIEHLIKKGALPQSIRFSTQEVQFQTAPGTESDESFWCSELSKLFNGQIEFNAKTPDPFKEEWLKS